jgi:hypothetical protein
MVMVVEEEVVVVAQVQQPIQKTPTVEEVLGSLVFPGQDVHLILFGRWC